jgi:hypothetical protein
MAFRPNYRGNRLERDRAARARSSEKQRKQEEKTAQRKAERAAAEVPTDDEQVDELGPNLTAPKKDET